MSRLSTLPVLGRVRESVCCREEEHEEDDEEEEEAPCSSSSKTLAVDSGSTGKSSSCKATGAHTTRCYEGRAGE